jgi:hypothetical protein
MNASLKMRMNVRPHLRSTGRRKAGNALCSVVVSIEKSIIRERAAIVKRDGIRDQSLHEDLHATAKTKGDAHAPHMT